MMEYISSGFRVDPKGASSATMMSVSTLAWMTWPSCARRTVPLMPIKQCSCTCMTSSFKQSFAWIILELLGGLRTSREELVRIFLPYFNVDSKKGETPPKGGQRDSRPSFCCGPDTYRSARLTLPMSCQFTAGHGQG